MFVVFFTEQGTELVFADFKLSQLHDFQGFFWFQMKSNFKLHQNQVVV